MWAVAETAMAETSVEKAAAEMAAAARAATEIDGGGGDGGGEDSGDEDGGGGDGGGGDMTGCVHLQAGPAPAACLPPPRQTEPTSPRTSEPASRRTCRERTQARGEGAPVGLGARGGKGRPMCGAYVLTPHATHLVELVPRPDTAFGAAVPRSST